MPWHVRGSSLVTEQPPLAFRYRGVCAYASTFDYRG
jgi:hypothetical protein